MLMTVNSTHLKEFLLNILFIDYVVLLAVDLKQLRITFVSADISDC